MLRPNIRNTRLDGKRSVVIVERTTNVIHVDGVLNRGHRVLFVCLSQDVQLQVGR